MGDLFWSEGGSCTEPNFPRTICFGTRTPIGMSGKFWDNKLGQTDGQQDMVIYRVATGTNNVTLGGQSYGRVAWLLE